MGSAAVLCVNINVPIDAMTKFDTKVDTNC